MPLHSALCRLLQPQCLQRPATVAQVALAAGAPTPASHSALSRPVLAAPVHVQHSMGPPRPTSTADGLSLPARRLSISSLSSCSWSCAPSSSTSLPPKALANTLRSGERLRGESDGLDWQTPGQLARTLPPTLRPRGPVLYCPVSLSTTPDASPPSPPRRARPSPGLT